MTDPIPALPDPEIGRPRRWVPSLVWIVPLLAAAVGLSLVIHSMMQRGPTITVSFQTAEGIEPGKTQVKYKDVTVGEVKEVKLSSDRSHVVAVIQLIKEAKPFAVADSRFWVVRARLAGTSVSGLGTLLSGSYIGVDAGHSTERQTEFTGLETPPVVASDSPGHRYVLTARDLGSLDVGSPVYYRRIEVGHVESFSLDSDGQRIRLGVFIKAPYDRFVSADSRFWHASGIDLSMDAGGIHLETQSLAAVVIGGIAFETPHGPGGDAPAVEGTQFDLAANHADALKVPDGDAVPVLLRFQQSIRGLSVGAPVDFRGVEIGRVRSLDIAYDTASAQFYSPVMVDLFPDRLGQVGTALLPPGKQRRVAVLGELVRRGLRAQLRPGSLLTGQLYVAFDLFPDAPRQRFNPHASPIEVPTMTSDLQELQQQLQSIMRKLDKIPFDTLGQDLHQSLTSLDTTLKRLDGLLQHTDAQTMPQLRDTLAEMQKTMETISGSVAGDSPLQQDTRQTLRSVTEATRALKALTESLDRNPESLLRGRKDRQK